jgi:hypothetical protein
MVNANVKIIEELKSFIEIVAEQPDIRKLFTTQASDFSRDRKLPLQKVVGLIINFLKRSLSIELNEFFDIIGESRSGCTKGAFCLQRIKLNPVFFQLWNYFLVNAFYHHYGKSTRRWKGFRLLSVDCSTNYLFGKPEVIEHFGTHKNQHAQVQVPMARIVQIQDVLNEIIVWGDIYPIAKSERQILNDNVGRLSPDSLTLFDRGFASYTLMYLLINQEQPRHFVMRCKVGFCKEVKAFVKGRKTSKIVELKPGCYAIEQLRRSLFHVLPDTTIKIRMVKVALSTGETEVLLTNLYDRVLYTESDLKQLYSLRWKIETSYGKQKNQLQMEIFSGHKVISIRQDYYACIFISNLQSLIEKQSETFLNEVNRGRKYSYKINKNASWASMKNNIAKLFLFENSENILLFLQSLFERNLEPMRPNRTFTRDRRARKLIGKYQTFTNYKRAI